MLTPVHRIVRDEEDNCVVELTVPDPADRRARKLFLTDKARPILGRIRNVANETRDEALVRLSPPERAQLVALLTRVHATLSDRVPPDAPDEPETRDTEDERETVAIPPRRTARRPAMARPPREAEGAVPAVEGTR